MAAFELSCLLVIFIIFVNSPEAPVLETLGPQVNPTLVVFNGDLYLYRAVKSTKFVEGKQLLLDIAQIQECVQLHKVDIG